MGVRKLWDLLKYAAECVEPSDLTGKRLAIDTNIWIQELQLGYEKYQESKNELIIKSFIRRILKLLHLNVKPVFLFDGGVPLAKKAEVENRRNSSKAVISRNHKSLARRYLNNLLSRKISNSGSSIKSDENLDHGDETCTSKLLLPDAREHKKIKLASDEKKIASSSDSSYVLKQLLLKSDDIIPKNNNKESISLASINQTSTLNLNSDIDRIDFQQGQIQIVEKSIGISPSISIHDNNNIKHDEHSSQKKMPENSGIAHIDELTNEILVVLKMFGIPFMICPMESDSQAAYLTKTGLVDAVQSKDNDVIIYGAKCVYRNIFDEHENIEAYYLDNIQKILSIDTSDMIDLAILLGCDYCEGVKSIGPISAMEVLASFQGDNRLKSFASSVSSGIVPENVNIDSVKKLIGELKLPVDFPREDVRDLYMNPVVEKSVLPFQWKSPDLESISRFKYVKEDQNLRNEVLHFRKSSMVVSRIAKLKKSFTKRLKNAVEILACKDDKKHVI